MTLYIEKVVVILGKVDTLALPVWSHTLAVLSWRLDSVENGMGLVVSMVRS
jgi:hypothetical protein